MNSIIVVPKNSGLRAYRQIALSSMDINGSKIIEARGEDVPSLVYEFSSLGKQTLGLTGEDLYREWCLGNRRGGLSVVQRIVWNDPSAMFGKPTLCLLGPEGKGLDDVPPIPTVCINAKYKNMSRRFLNALERQGYTFRKTYLNGCVEMACAEGISDLVIDIVYTGDSMRDNKLQVYQKIFGSDFLVIGGANGSA
ncbi:MAG: hypothetical protein HYY37_02885 [Candidatus Aenigmarchaeota archaeon]|nr:hypothetical protein [Candidatus Aenigmarchaeota archaeon]